MDTLVTVTVAVTAREEHADAVRRLLIDALDGGPDCTTRLAQRPACVGEHRQFDDIHPPTRGADAP